MKTFRHTFEVSGSYPFPVDMLRYDGCFPMTEGDSMIIADSIANQGQLIVYRVQVRRVGTERAWRPNQERWNSFGWTVDLKTLATETVPT